jgi:hypothetical protein
MALVLVACGGSARSGAHASGDLAAGADGIGGDDSHSVGGQPNSHGGEPSLGAAGGVGGEPSSAGIGPSSAGAGGQLTLCFGLDCLKGAHFIYQPTRTWHAPAGPINLSSDLAEADYTPMSGPPLAVTFSDDAMGVQLQPSAGGATVLGARKSAGTDRAWYELELFAGGRFVVQIAADGDYVAEHTIYGSGSPIISSTRGTLKYSP